MMFVDWRGLISLLALSVALLACGKSTRNGSPDGGVDASDSGGTGFGGSNGASDGGGDQLGSCKPGRTPLRRLAPDEYDHTVRDVLSDTSAPGRAFPVSATNSGFSNDADAYRTDVITAQAWMTAAEALTETYRQERKLSLPCAAQGEACAKGFIEEMGKRLFRRPVLEDEVQSYLALFTAGAADGGSFEEGLAWVLERMLQSPHFLYRVELETSGMTPGTVVPLNDYSLATRLSYLLWSSAPDPELLAAADAHQLSEEEGLAQQVQRMMASPSFATSLSSFHRQWMQWDRIVNTTKRVTTTPPWDSQLQSDMIRESELFVSSVFGGGGSFRDLLTAPYSFVNPRLAEFYGVDYPAKGSDFVRLEVPHRAGLLTQPSMLAGFASADVTSPVQRGYLIRRALLCTITPPEAGGLVMAPPDVPPDSTTRQRIEALTGKEPCKSCHLLMEPLGFPLENFDEFGRYRDMENGQPVDASGGLTLVPSLGNLTDPSQAPVNGAADLGAQLAALPEARECLVTQWFRFAAGHTEDRDDACTLSALYERFNTSGQKLDDLLVAIATSDAFRNREAAP